MPRIRAIERFIAEREIGDDISLDRNLKQRPLKPGWIAQMTAGDVTRLKPDRNQYIATETFDQCQAFAAAIACSRSALAASAQAFVRLGQDSARLRGCESKHVR